MYQAVSNFGCSSHRTSIRSFLASARVKNLQTALLVITVWRLINEKDSICFGSFGSRSFNSGNG
jgi:hypothetical protein